MSSQRILEGIVSGEAQSCGDQSCVLTPQLTRNQGASVHTLTLAIPLDTSLETVLPGSAYMMRSFVSSGLQEAFQYLPPATSEQRL